MRSDGGELVSVVIPIHNQARYLAAAIESVLSQSYGNHEVIVVDDGSDDDPARVAAAFPRVQFVRRENGGTPIARNRGLALSRGEFLVFLDADDRLLPAALERSVAALRERPEWVFVFGRARMIREDGSQTGSIQPPADEFDLYAEFLRRCPVWNPAAAMFRRRVFEEGISFDPSMKLCSDYLLYLTAASRWPAGCHREIVSEYRQHESNKSTNSAEMMRYLLRALSAQEPRAREEAHLAAALRAGIGNCRRDYYLPAVRGVFRRWRSGGDRRGIARSAALLLRVTPAVLPRLAAGAVYRWARRSLAGRPRLRRPS
jgi:glycosyltransferase involved in cell wall biosynthesis